MVKLTCIYTKGGDGGKTSLGDGTRVLKDTLRVEAMGTVDEANCILGLIEYHLSDETLQNHIQSMQQDLFDMGADLCCPSLPDSSHPRLQIQDHSIQHLENLIDHYNESLAPLNSFVLPGGSLASAYLHMGRSVVRRAERVCVSLSQESYVNPLIIKYLNRLSDFLFVLSRYLNDEGKKDVLWSPGRSMKK